MNIYLCDGKKIVEQDIQHYTHLFAFNNIQYVPWIIYLKGFFYPRCPLCLGWI